jgi:hypothetical protein
MEDSAFGKADALRHRIERQLRGTIGRDEIGGRIEHATARRLAGTTNGH